jgi:hypothetical protein
LPRHSSKLARYLSVMGLIDLSYFARSMRAFRGRALREHILFLYISLSGEWPRLRIERAHSYRARSASKKGTLPHFLVSQKFLVTFPWMGPD